MDAGFQCVVILDLNGGMVSSITISDHLGHVAVGYSNGMVSKLRITLICLLIYLVSKSLPVN